MNEPTVITSAQNPRVKDLVRLGESRHRRERGLFVAEGWRAVERALRAGLTLVELYECRELSGWTVDHARIIDALIPAASPPARFVLTTALMSKAAYCENPEGVLGVFAQPATDLAGLDARITSSRVAPTMPTQSSGHGTQRGNRTAQNRPAETQAVNANDLLLVVVGAEKPGNIGAMMRTADAAGATAVIVADPVVDLFNPNAIRASTGAVFALPTATGEATVVRQWLQKRGVALWAAAPPLPDRASIEYASVDWRRPSAIVIGPEDTGLAAEWLDTDLLRQSGGGRVNIPMRGRAADSLNASVAAAVLLFEARRQRG